MPAPSPDIAAEWLRFQFPSKLPESFTPADAQAQAEACNADEGRFLDVPLSSLTAYLRVTEILDRLRDAAASTGQYPEELTRGLRLFLDHLDDARQTVLGMTDPKVRARVMPVMQGAVETHLIDAEEHAAIVAMLVRYPDQTAGDMLAAFEAVAAARREAVLEDARTLRRGEARAAAEALGAAATAQHLAAVESALDAAGSTAEVAAVPVDPDYPFTVHSS